MKSKIRTALLLAFLLIVGSLPVTAFSDLPVSTEISEVHTDATDTDTSEEISEELAITKSSSWEEENTGKDSRTQNTTEDKSAGFTSNLNTQATSTQANRDVAFSPAEVTVTVEKDHQAGTDLFNTTDAIPFKNHYLKIELNHNADNGDIAEGTTLQVELIARNNEPMYLRYPQKFTSNTTLKDNDSGEKLADLNIKQVLRVEFTFSQINKSFIANIDSPMIINSSHLFKYFDNNPNETQVEQTFDLYINQINQNKSVTFLFDKPKPAATTVDFYKTRGLYGKNNTEEFGEGRMLYNIGIASKLRKDNEFFIYDTPDVNLAFNNSHFRAYYTTGEGQYYGSPFLDEGQNQYIGDGPQETRMEAELYDIYYLTTESASPSTPRQAMYEDKVLTINRHNIITGENGFDSKDTAAVPKNILVEKLHGEELTVTEQEKIQAAGGLNQTVGKGFKLHIKNFQHPLYEEGGSFILIFNMDIVNPSPNLTDEGNPRYFNSASHYAQEIPSCNPDIDDNCKPITCEKTRLSDLSNSKHTTSAIVEEGSIGAIVDKYTLINFSKQDLNGKPLAKATFTIYNSDAQAQKGEIAVNKDNLPLKNLITNSQGKLCSKNADNSLQEVRLLLKRGYYIISETLAPDGYQKAEDYFLTIGAKVEPVIMQNKQEMTSISVNKIWNDKNNQSGNRPKEITVKLLADNKDTGKTLILSPENNWQNTFDNLPKYQGDHKLDYSIKEIEVDKYKTSIAGDVQSGFVITNSFIPEETETTKPEHPQQTTKPEISQETTKPEILQESVKPATQNQSTNNVKNHPKTGEIHTLYDVVGIILLSSAALIFTFRKKSKIAKH